ncbi:phospholipid methyltransferase, partial [Burkholderia pseudomallei]
EQAIAIEHGAFAMHLGPGGAFYQITYLPRCPIPVRRLAAIGIRAERIGSAWANMPPAAVYRLQRCADFSGSPWSLGRPWPSARPPSTAA